MRIKNCEKIEIIQTIFHFLDYRGLKKKSELTEEQINNLENASGDFGMSTVEDLYNIVFALASGEMTKGEAVKEYWDSFVNSFMVYGLNISSILFIYKEIKKYNERKY